MRTRFVVATLAVLCMVVLASPSDAASKKGFFFSIDGASLTPGNVNTPLLASVPADNTLSGGSTPLTSETTWTTFDSSLTWAGEFGYSWGDKGSLSVSYWNYSDNSGNDGNTFGQTTNYNFFGVGPGSNFGYTHYYYDMRWDFDQDMDASALDIDFTRSHSVSDNLDMTWGVGLRVANFEDTVEGSYTAFYDFGTYPTTYFYRFPASRSVEGDGMGFTTKVGVNYALNDHLGIGSNLRVGFLTTDVDSASSITDLDGYYASSGAVWSEENSVEDEVTNTIDFDLNLAIKINDSMSLDLGYVYSTWSDIATPTLGRADYGTDDQAAPNFPGENRDKISFSGPRLRFKMAFGK